jgi:prevent-host-death family protein
VEKIGIRELRQHASVWVAKAKAGKVILITDRGQPVARLVPMTRNENARNKLIDDGQSRIDLRAAAELDHNNYYRLELGLCGG